jgi:exosortase B
MDAVVPGHARVAGLPGLRPWLVAAAGFLLMFAPSYWNAASGIWQTDEFGHGPIVMAIAAWLMWQQRAVLVPGGAMSTTIPTRVTLAPAAVLFVPGALAYLVGRALSISSAEFIAHWLVAGGVVVALAGLGGLRAVWFAWLYLLFAVPLPASLVEALTGPLKQAISMLVVDGLHTLGYPIARSGVMISVGPYQLLVADACSGLNSMFSLAALGTLFVHLVARRRPRWQVAALVASIVPIAFVANILRVTALILVTYHFGDAAGQGMVHGLAGIVLMLLALAIFVAFDACLSALPAGRSADPTAPRAKA